MLKFKKKNKFIAEVEEIVGEFIASPLEESPDAIRDLLMTGHVSLNPGPYDAPEAAQPTEEEIRQAAYYKWLHAGQPEGLDIDHWVEAEQEMRRLV